MIKFIVDEQIDEGVHDLSCSLLNVLSILSNLIQKLNKKIPKNPRYEHVKRTIDTGMI